MLAKTHLAFGIFIGLILAPFLNTGSIWIFMGLVMIGSLLPDIDQPNSTISNKIPILPRIINLLSKHRGIFHSVFFALIAFIISIYLIDKVYASAIFIGYFSHLLSDGMTKNGINFLHPVANLKLSGFIETGTTAELLLFIGLIAMITIKLI